MAPDTAYQQMPATQSAAPEPNYPRPVMTAPAPGMPAPELVKQTEKASGMVYSQQPGIPMMPFGVVVRSGRDAQAYPNYPSNQPYMYSGYPWARRRGVRRRRTVNGHVQQNTYPAKQQPMYDNVNHQDGYATGMQANRGMMNHVDVQQANASYPYEQRMQPMNNGWMHSQQGGY